MVSLQTSNELSVEVRCKPGGAIVIKIIGIDDDPPTISTSVDPPPNIAGWHNRDVTITFVCNDATSGIAECPPPVIITSEGSNQVITGTTTDVAGNSTSASVVLNIDKTTPVITITDPADGTVTGEANYLISGYVSEPVSLIVNGQPVSIGSDNNFRYGPVILQEGVNTFQFTATDAAGNQGRQNISLTLRLDDDGDGTPNNLDQCPNTPADSIVDSEGCAEFQRDKTPPFITASVSPSPNAYGWNNQDIAIAYTCVDILSGIAVCPSPVAIATEGAGQVVQGTATDLAGNSASVEVTVNIDRTAPAVNIVHPQNGATISTSKPVISAGLSDNLSGIDNSAVRLTIDSTDVTSQAFITDVGIIFTPQADLTYGIHTLVVTASDKAGNYKEIHASFTTVSASSSACGISQEVSLPLFTESNEPFIFPEPGFDAGGFKELYYTNYNGPIEVKDINGDSIPDVVIANYVNYAWWSNKSRISTLLGKGNGRFEKPVSFAEINGLYYSVALDDFNGDGYPDLALTTSPPDRQYKLRILIGSGDGAFREVSNYNISATGKVLTGAFNTDPYVDIAIAGVNGRVILFSGNGDGSFQGPVESNITTNYSVTDAVAADLNHDGIDDIALTTGRGLFVLRENGNGTFSQSVVMPEENNLLSNLTLGDFNGDGYTDIFISSLAQFALHPDFIVLINDGQGNPSVRIESQPGTVIPQGSYSIYGSTSVKAADINKDENLDLLIASPGNLLSFPGKGDGKFETNVEHTVSGGSLNIGDFDKNGNIDVVTVGSYMLFVLLSRDDGTFIDRMSLTTDAYSPLISSADFDGDNAQDIARAGYRYDLLFSTILNRDNGRFEATSEPFQEANAIKAGNGPTSVRMGDLNRDGYPDVVTANELSGDVSVLLNNGNGEIERSVSYLTGEGPVSVLLEDLNRDGSLDIVTANSGSNDISILLGRGDGTFLAHTTYAVGSNPYRLIVGDFNGDSHQDISVTHQDRSINYISILYGNGDGTFKPYKTVTINGSNANSIQKGDFNRDGMVDIVVLNYSLYNWGGVKESIITTLLGNGDGTFAIKDAYKISSYSGLIFKGLLAGDLNSDGSPDLIAIIPHSAPGAFVLINDGTGRFNKKQDLYDIADEVSAALGDLNNDGELDLIAIANDAGSLQILLGQGDGTFQKSRSIGWQEDVYSLDTGDINGDGISDIALVDYENLSIIYGGGEGIFSGENIVHDGQYFSRVLAAADFNGDNNQDIVVHMIPRNTQTDKFKTAIYWGTGYNTFKRGPILLETTNGEYYSAASADFNVDGLPDIAVQSNSAVLIFLNRGSGAFEQPLPHYAGDLNSYIKIADINKDGRPDIINRRSVRVSYGNYDYCVSIHIGNGDGTFQYLNSIPLGKSPGGIALQDFNADGFTDLAVSHFQGNKLRVYLNNGNGSFNNATVYEVGIWQGSALTDENLIAGDFNQDNKIDIAVTDSITKTIAVLYGKGDGTFESVEHYSVGYWATGSMLSKDFNLDGRPDIAIGYGNGTGFLDVIFNALPPIYTPPVPPKGLTGKAGDRMVVINWNANTEPDIAGYNVYRSLSAGGGYVKVNNSLIASLSYTDNTATNGITYYYTVSAVDKDGGESPYARKVKATPNPPDTIPPAIAITTPADGRSVISQAIFVSGATDDLSATIKVNGITGIVHKQSGIFTAYEVPLKAGENIITATAVDPAGNQSTKSIRVIYALPASITGIVKDEYTGQPVAYATLAVTDAERTQSLTTGWDGKYTFARLVPGEVIIRAEAYGGYDTITMKQVLSPGESLNLDIPLPLYPAAMIGWVSNSYTYQPIVGATVTVTDRKKTQTAATNTQGYYEVNGIAPYDVTITVSKEGYETYTETQTLSNIRPNNRNYYLKRLPPSAPIGLAATPGTGFVELNWNPNPEQDISGYKIYRSTAAGSGYIYISTVAGATYKDTAVTGGIAYYYVIKALNTSQRESSYSNEASAVPIKQKIALHITSPTNGATTYKAGVIVTGTIDTASSEAGVVIDVTGQSGTNRFLAQINENTFAAIVSLQQGINTIKAIATDQDGNKADASITVNAALSPEIIKLTAIPSSGILTTKPDGTISFETTLEVETYLTNPVSNYSWDFNGDGTVEVTGTAPKITAQYQYVGLYYPQVTITDTSGNQYQASTIVNVLSKEELDVLLKDKWEGMKGALVGGDVEGAVKYFTSESQGKYKAGFELLKDQMSNIFNRPEVLNLISIIGNVAKYENIVSEDNGRRYSYPVIFILDENGLWKIKNF